jgi:hypothetical protein
MRTKKKLLFAAALMLWACTTQAQELSLLVHSDAGNPHVIALSGIHQIIFSEGTANVLLKNGDSSAHSLSTISHLTFSAVNASAIEPVAVPSALNLYPNPVRDELFVKSDTEIESIALFGLQGNLLLRSNVQSSSATLSLGSLPKGIYLIQVKRADAISTQKIIKL